jgi:predicted XRE-type DNA-binding protein
VPNKTGNTKIQKSSGNVFEDLGISDAPEILAKAELANRICSIISQRGLTQIQAARILDVDQPKISALMRGELKGFSTDRLFRFLNALGRDIDIVIKPKPSSRSEARIRVVRLAARRKAS